MNSVPSPGSASPAGEELIDAARSEATLGAIGIEPGSRSGLAVEEFNSNTVADNAEYLAERRREELLVEELRAGNRDAFRELYEMNVEAVGRFVGRRVSSAQVDDIVAEVFLRAWKARDRFEARGFRYLSWLLRIAQNHIISMQRRPIREDVSLESTAEPRIEDPMDRVVDHLAGKSMRELLTALPERQRIVLELRFVEDLNSTEVGQILGISSDAVRQLTVRSLKQVRSLLGTTDNPSGANA
jgi:RNA polymerase sigma factor (sigma-70 family)